MERAEFTVKINTPHKLSGEQKAEILAEIRNALQVLNRIYPEMGVLVTKHFTDEELMEALRGAQEEIKDNSQSREYCYHFDEAQGRHYCVNDMVKSDKCHGVCKYY